MATGDSRQYPLLILPKPTPVQRDGGRGFPPTVHFPDHARQSQRLAERFRNIRKSFDARRLELRARSQNDDPDLVLVLETVGSVNDFVTAAQRVQGLEWLAAIDHEIDPDQDFYDIEESGKRLAGKLFLVGSNRAALDDVVRMWEKFSTDPKTKLGAKLEAWKQVFKHLKDVRFWGPSDRLEPSLRDAWQFSIEHGEHVLRFEIEAWHFLTPVRNSTATAEIRALITLLGGAVLHESVIADIAYHGFLVEVPAVGVKQLLTGDSALLQSDRIMFFRAQGQAVAPIDTTVERVPAPPPPAQFADGSPVVALFDGLPIANHPLLRGRVEIDDPEGWAEDYPVANRNHGTAMASLIALGDLNAEETPLVKPIYVRPIMRPTQTGDQHEERTPDDRLLIDFVHVAIRRMFESEPGQPAVAPGVRVINLSVGDQHRRFSGELSPWARLLDWLQHKYNVLFIISAGNHLDDLVIDVTAGSLQSMPLEQRSTLAMRAACRDDMLRRVLTPAESVNALTVGASHADAGAMAIAPGRFLLFSEGGVAPYSSIGPGFRRSVKPDILLPGGRILYREATQSPPGQTKVQPIRGLQPPGHFVAAPQTAQGNAVYTRGTSNAAALGTRWGARAHSVLDLLRADHPTLEPRYDAVLIKALLAHGATVSNVRGQILDARPDVTDGHARRRLISRYAGLGVANVERALTCTAQRATLLGVGSLRNEKALEFRVPVPHALHAKVVIRRITLTLAWMTPINPRNSKYRVARLWVDLPQDPLDGDRVEGEWRQLRQGTLHHEVFEGDKGVSILEDTYLPVRVNCVADAGRIIEPVEFALCVSLEVSQEVDLPIYLQIRERIEHRVGIQPGISG